jgi:hydroxyacylglutathione hydrolase
MNTLNIKKIEVTNLVQNCRILSVQSECVVVDPGGDVDKILSLISEGSLTCKEIWLTHSHIDHCGGVYELISKTGAKLIAHQAEKKFRERVKEMAVLYGIGNVSHNCPEPDVFTTDLEKVQIGDYFFKVIHTPGHSEGHVVFYCEQEKILIAGDTLFKGSIGRTDLPGGNYEQLLRSVKKNIYTLPDETKVLSGHGPDTTVGYEKRNNMFSMEIMSVKEF